ncbi:MAG: hypothetical protein ACKOU6_05075 [Planctomycetota bacterium]
MRPCLGQRQKLPTGTTIRAIWAEIREEMLKKNAEFEKSGIFLGKLSLTWPVELVLTHRAEFRHDLPICVGEQDLVFDFLFCQSGVFQVRMGLVWATHAE